MKMKKIDKWRRQESGSIFFRKIGGIPSSQTAERGSSLFSSFNALAVEKLGLTLIFEKHDGDGERITLSTR